MWNSSMARRGLEGPLPGWQRCTSSPAVAAELTHDRVDDGRDDRQVIRADGDAQAEACMSGGSTTVNAFP